MKTTLTTILTALCLFTFAQSKTSPVEVKPTGVTGRLSIIDTIYIIHNSDINRIYTLLEVGEAGVSSSDNYSINQRKLYHSEFAKVDSVLRPQILKWYPPVKKKQ